MSYSSLNEITQRCNSEGIPFWKAVQYSDMEEREVTEQASFQMMQKMWNAMKAAGDSYDKDQKSRSGLVGGMGGQMRSYMEKRRYAERGFYVRSDCTGIGDGRVECLYAPDWSQRRLPEPAVCFRQCSFRYTAEKQHRILRSRRQCIQPQG